MFDKHSKPFLFPLFEPFQARHESKPDPTKPFIKSNNPENICELRIFQIHYRVQRIRIRDMTLTQSDRNILGF